MHYSQFSKQLKKSLYGSDVVQEEKCCDESIILTEDGNVYVNGKLTELKSVEEAVQCITQIHFEEDIAQALYEDIPDVKIAQMIREFHSVKITNTLIESYKELASSKTFSVDPVIQEIRCMNIASTLIENKLDYILNDGSVIAIGIELQNKLNSILDDKYQVVEYMRECKSNFINVIKEISKE